MKFLDLNGLTHFWSKIKVFFVKTEGASVINMDEDNDGLTVQHTGSANTILTPSGFVSYNLEGDNETMVARLQYGDLLLSKIHLKNGTSSQILIADGSTKTINAANGICGLDSKGNVPLSQLGNLDTTVAEVVTALPTTNIKKHIYLIKDTGGVTQNQYEEYIYTGDTSAKYDASKWEKLGDFRATVDLADYAKKNKAANALWITPNQGTINLSLLNIDGETISDIVLQAATPTSAGVMTASDKSKLNGIANNANNYSLPTASSTIKGGITLGYSQNGKNYPVAIDSNGKAYVNVPWTDTNTTYSLATSTKDGLMSKADKVKIDGIDTTYAKKNEAVGAIDVDESANAVDFEYKDINGTTLGYVSLEKASENVAGVMSSEDRKKLDRIASGATADSAITTAEIDALFT